MVVDRVDLAMIITMAIQEGAMEEVMEGAMIIIPEMTSMAMGVQDGVGAGHSPEPNLQGRTGMRPKSGFYTQPVIH